MRLYNFLLICVCVSLSACSKSNEEARESIQSRDKYIIDTSLFISPCILTEDPVHFRGQITYRVDDIEKAVKQMNDLLSRYSVSIETRNEYVSNNEFRKDFGYKLPTEKFSFIERQLDSVFRKVESKEIVKEQARVTALIADLAETRKFHGLYVNKYNSNPGFEERKDLVTMIRDMENRAKYLRDDIKRNCENKTELRLTFKMKLKKTDEMYVEPQRYPGYIYR